MGTSKSPGYRPSDGGFALRLKCSAKKKNPKRNQRSHAPQPLKQRTKVGFFVFLGSERPKKPEGEPKFADGSEPRVIPKRHYWMKNKQG